MKVLIVVLMIVTVVTVPCCEGQSFNNLFNGFTSLLNRFRNIINTGNSGNSRLNGGRTISKTVSNIEFFNCGSNNAIAFPENIQVPDPIRVPGSFIVSASGTTSQTIDGAVNGRIRVCRKVPFVGCVEIPCINNVGSCSYTDLCSKTGDVVRQLGSCPLGDASLCRCPLPAGRYVLNNFRANVRQQDFRLAAEAGVLSQLINGDYEVTISGTNNGRELGCVRMEMSVS